MTPIDNVTVWGVDRAPIAHVQQVGSGPMWNWRCIEHNHNGAVYASPTSALHDLAAHLSAEHPTNP